MNRPVGRNDHRGMRGAHRVDEVAVEQPEQIDVRQLRALQEQGDVCEDRVPAADDRRKSYGRLNRLGHACAPAPEVGGPIGRRAGGDRPGPAELQPDDDRELLRRKPEVARGDVVPAGGVAHPAVLEHGDHGADRRVNRAQVSLDLRMRQDERDMPGEDLAGQDPVGGRNDVRRRRAQLLLGPGGLEREGGRGQSLAGLAELEQPPGVQDVPRAGDARRVADGDIDVRVLRQLPALAREGRAHRVADRARAQIGGGDVRELELLKPGRRDLTLQDLVHEIDERQLCLGVIAVQDQAYQIGAPRHEDVERGPAVVEPGPVLEQLQAVE